MDASRDGSVVLRFRDGRAERCVLDAEFSPASRAIRVRDGDGDSREVDIDLLKAVFFLKDPKRRSGDVDSGAHPVLGRPVARVEFFDGEIMHGLVEHYSVEHSGFFLYPISPDTNNERVFVVARSLHTVSLEG